MINSNKYHSLLDQLKTELNEKHSELTENAYSFMRIICLCVSLMTRQKLLQLGWEVLIHPLYSTDIALWISFISVFTKFSQWEKKFHSLEDCKRHLEQFFAQNDKKFWEDGIMKLPGKCQKTVGQKSLHCSIKFSVKMKSVSLIFT